MEWILQQESAQKNTPGEEKSSAAPAETQTHNPSIMSSAITTELFQLTSGHGVTPECGRVKPEEWFFTSCKSTLVQLLIAR